MSANQLPMAYWPGLVLLVSGMLGLHRQIRAFLIDRRTPERPRPTVRGLVASSIGSSASVLLGVGLLLERLDHPWRSWDLGLYGALLAVIAIIRSLIRVAIDYLRGRFPPQVKPMGTGTVLGWVLGTAAGYLLGIVLTIAVAAVFLILSRVESIPTTGWSRILVAGAVGGVAGLSLGVFQARVLSPYVPHARRWIWLTVAGASIGNALEHAIELSVNIIATGAPPVGLNLISTAGRGAIIGIFQWRVIRAWSDRGNWWIVFSLFAPPAGYMLSHAIVPGSLDVLTAGFWLGRLVSGLGQAVVTGVPLLWFQGRRAPMVVPSPA